MKRLSISGGATCFSYCVTIVCMEGKSETEHNESLNKFKKSLLFVFFIVESSWRWHDFSQNNFCLTVFEIHLFLQPFHILRLTLNCIQWWGSSSRTQRSDEYFFIAITPKSTLIWSGSTCESSIYRSNKSICKLFVSDMNTWYHVKEVVSKETGLIK